MASQIDEELPVDAGNPHLNIGPASLFSAIANTPLGQRLVMTVRTSSTTLTVFLDGQEAADWAAHLARDAGRMSKSGLVVAGPTAPVNGKGISRA